MLISELPPHALPAPFKLDPTLKSTILSTLALFSWLGPDCFSGGLETGPPTLTDQHGHKEQDTNLLHPTFSHLKTEIIPEMRAEVIAKLREEPETL